MEEKRFEIFGQPSPGNTLRYDSEGRLLLSEEVQRVIDRAVDVRIADFAAALEKRISWCGGLLSESLKEELRKWSVLQGCREPKVMGFWDVEPVAVCQRCNGAGTEPHSSLIPCPICNGASPKAAAPPISQPSPLSQCCKAATFVEDNQRRVCKKCGCTRPL